MYTGMMSDAIYYFDRVVVPLAPSWILLYEGDNDLSNGKKSPEQVFADYKAFFWMKKPTLYSACWTLKIPPGWMICPGIRSCSAGGRTWRISWKRMPISRRSVYR